MTDVLGAVSPAPTFKRLESVWIGKDNALLDAMFEFYAPRAERYAELLTEIGHYAHDHSTGPAVPDALWTIREMAYDG